MVNQEVSLDKALITPVLETREAFKAITLKLEVAKYQRLVKFFS